MKSEKKRLLNVKSIVLLLCMFVGVFVVSCPVHAASKISNWERGNGRPDILFKHLSVRGQAVMRH